MKAKERKNLQLNFARENISHFFNLLEIRFNPQFDSIYIREIKRLSQGFNIRLTREEKLKFCKNCNIYWNNKTKQIRLNSLNSCIEHICKNCNFVRRFKYK